MHQRLRLTRCPVVGRQYRLMMLVIPMLVFGCGAPQTPAPSRPPERPATEAQAGGAAHTPTNGSTQAAEAPAAAVDTEAVAGKSPGLKFHTAGFDDAVKVAQQNNKLLFVDAWADWCHTCLSMNSYVFPNPSLAEFSQQFVFVALDTEDPENAAFFARFEMDTWPTFMVLDPSDQTLLGWWTGAASATELAEFLRQAAIAHDALANTNADPAVRALVQAQIAESEGDSARAAAAYQKALRVSAPTWPRRSELLLGYIGSLLNLKRYDECTQLGDQHMHEVTGAALPVQFAQRYFNCTGQSKLPGQRRRIDAILLHLKELIDRPEGAMSPDDRTDAMAILGTAYRQLGQPEKAKELFQARLVAAEQAAATAQTLEQARTFDNLRVQAYITSKREADAISLLTLRTEQFPDSYDPPRRLAEIYLTLGQIEPALGELGRAIARSSGQRKASLLQQKATLQGRQGDFRGQVNTLREEVLERERSKRSAADESAWLAASKRLREAEAALLLR